MDDVAYWAPPEENPNFVSRPPDPGLFSLYKTIGWDALYHSPFNATKRWSELTLESSSYFNVAGRLLDPDEANQKYGLGGQLRFDEPIKEEAAQLMYRRKIDEIDRDYLISSGQTTGLRKAASVPVSMAASLLDPINFAALFIPVVGEARIARIAQSVGGSSVLGRRLVQGALTGLSGTAMVEPFILLPNLQEQANYGLKDSAVNLGYGAALGALLHTGIASIADRMKNLKPRDGDALFESAMNNVLKDEPVVSPGKVAEFTDELTSNPERITGAALKLEDGTILQGKSHPSILMEYGEKGLSDKTVDGFMTDQGRFVDRDEGMRIAKSAGQLDPEGAAQQRSDLYAEDVNKNLDGYTESEQRQEQLAQMSARDLDANGIPRRDARGKFLSKEQRLEMLNQKLQDDRLEAERAKQGNRSQIVNESTKENLSRLPKDDIGMTGETTKDTQSIESDIAEIEKSLDLSDEEKTRLREDIRAEAGDVEGRAKGIVEGLKCIVRNLI